MNDLRLGRAGNPIFPLESIYRIAGPLRDLAPVSFPLAPGAINNVNSRDGVSMFAVRWFFFSFCFGVSGHVVSIEEIGLVFAGSFILFGWIRL